MTKQVQLRRGSTSQSDAFTGAVGEVTVDTTAKSLRVHDGSTVGGSTIPNLTEVLTAIDAAAGLSFQKLVTVPHRYWRVGLSSVSSGQTSVAEFKFYNGNVAMPRSFSATGDWPVEWYDNNPTTNAEPGTGGFQKFEVFDFGTPQSFDSFGIYETDIGFIGSMTPGIITIQHSDDGTTWTDVTFNQIGSYANNTETKFTLNLPTELQTVRIPLLTNPVGAAGEYLQLNSTEDGLLFSSVSSGGGSGGGIGGTPSNLIGSQTFTGGETSYTFSVPSTFTDLQLSFLGNITSGDTLDVYFNNDFTNSNYLGQHGNHYGFGNTSDPAILTGTNDTARPQVSVLTIPSYNNPVWYKQGTGKYSFWSSGDFFDNTYVIEWSNVAPITSVTIKCSGSATLMAGSVATLTGSGGSTTVLGSSGSNANGYYDVRPTGTIEQWGKVVAFFSGEGTVPITFPVEYTDVNSINIQLVEINDGTTANDTWMQVQQSGWSVTGFTAAYAASSSGNNGNGFFWRAIGK